MTSIPPLQLISTPSITKEGRGQEKLGDRYRSVFDGLSENDRKEYAECLMEPAHMPSATQSLDSDSDDADDDRRSSRFQTQKANLHLNCINSEYDEYRWCQTRPK